MARVYTSALLSQSVNGLVGKQNSELIEEIEELTNDDAEEEKETVTIDEDDQDRYTKEAAFNCSILIKQSNESMLSNFCLCLGV